MDRTGELRVQFALEAVGEAGHFLETTAVARLVVTFGIATRGEVNAFCGFVVGQIEDSSPADGIGFFGRLGVERGGARAESGGSGCRARGKRREQCQH